MPGWLRIALCVLLCIGATLDDIDYINAIRASRTMNVGRGSSIADDDSDDQHAHFVLAPAGSFVDLTTPFLSALYLIGPSEPRPAAVSAVDVRSGRAPPSFRA